MSSRSRPSSSFGSHSRAIDGYIVTFHLAADSIEVRHFTQIVRTDRYKTVEKGESAAQQAIEWADRHQAKIMTISSPETIARDLMGTRAPLEAKRAKDGPAGGMQKHPADVVQFPELTMLRGRRDLFEAPSAGSQDPASRHIKHVRSRRPTHSGDVQ
jgi:hypothetical protein